MSEGQAQREMSLKEVVDKLREGQPNHRAVREYDEGAGGSALAWAKRMILVEQVLDGDESNRTGSEPEEIQQAIEKASTLRRRLTGLDELRERVKDYLVDEEGAAIELARIAGQPVPSRQKRSSYPMRVAAEKIEEYPEGSIEASFQERIDALASGYASLQKRYAFASKLAKMFTELTNTCEPGEEPIEKRVHAFGEKVLNARLLKKTADWFNKSDPNKEAEARAKAKELGEQLDAERKEREGLAEKVTGLEARLEHASPIVGVFAEILDKVDPSEDRTYDRALRYRDGLFAVYDTDPSKLERATKRVVDAAQSRVYDGCFSGDCPHSTQTECEANQKAVREELEEAVGDYDAVEGGS